MKHFLVAALLSLSTVSQAQEIDMDLNFEIMQPKITKAIRASYLKEGLNVDDVKQIKVELHSLGSLRSQSAKLQLDMYYSTSWTRNDGYIPDLCTVTLTKSATKWEVTGAGCESYD